MSYGGENSSQSSTMEFIEESMPNIQDSVTTALASNIPSNPSASPPQTLITSNSPPPPPTAVPQQFSIITSPPPPPHPLPPSTFTSPPPPRFANNHDDDDDHYFNSFPPGYRFCPHDHELVLYYLSKKVNGLPLPRNRIVDVTLYQHDPEFLADRYKNYGEKEWYFFTPRDRKYKNGSRPNRAAGGGYWKATGADKEIKYNKSTVGVGGKVTVEKVHVGFRKALVYYTGKAPKGDKTNWIMHEFRVKDSPPQVRNDRDDMRLDDWVLCRIYKKHEKRTNNVDSNVRNRQSNGENTSGSIDDIDEDYVNRHDRNPNDLAAIEADYAGEIYDTGTGSLENSFPMLDDLSPQQTALSGFSDAVDFYPAPPNSNYNYSGMLHDTQVPSLAETYGSPSPMASNINPDYWSSMQQGYQDSDEYLNSTNCWSHYNIAATPLVNLRPTNTVPPICSLRPISTALPNGSLLLTNTAPLTRSLPPMNTAHPTGRLPPMNTARPPGRFLPTNPANSPPMSAMNVEAKLHRQPPQHYD